VLATLQIDVEPDYMPYLQKYPLPADLAPPSDIGRNVSICRRRPRWTVDGPRRQ
jgi:hypothetical protein